MTGKAHKAVQAIDRLHPGFSADFVLADCIASKVSEHTPQDMFERAVVQQCQLAWRLYSSIIVLIADGFGISATILTRSLFELVVGVRYLLRKKGDVGVLRDFRDYGIKIACESAGGPTPELEPMYGEVKDSFKKGETWHRKTISALVTEVGLGKLLPMFYKLTSSLAHGDAMACLIETGPAWQRVASSSDSHFSEVSLESSYMLMSILYDDVSDRLHPNCAHEVEAMNLACKRRLQALGV